VRYKALHQITAAAGLMTIASFLLATVVSETIGDLELIAEVKKMIVDGLLLLLVCIPLTVISGKRMAALYPNNPYVEAKARRMKWIAINAVIFLIPLALGLNYLAQIGRFDIIFYSLQILEFICGATNIFLFTKMFSDGRQINNSNITLDN